MLHLKCSSSFMSDFSGPLLDDEAPCSGMGAKEFNLLQPMIAPHWGRKLQCIPAEIQPYPFRSCGTGQHSSDSRRILGSVISKAETDQNYFVHIRHLIIQGSSQWIVGRKMTKYCDILHRGQKNLVFHSQLTQSHSAMPTFIATCRTIYSK